MSLIAIDFDGTITEKNIFPFIGKARPYAFEVIKALQKEGHKCFLWTCRNGKELAAAKNLIEKNGVIMDGYNDGHSTGSPKIIANVYIDDSAYPFSNKNINWLEIAINFNVLDKIEVKEEDQAEVQALLLRKSILEKEE